MKFLQEDLSFWEKETQEYCALGFVFKYGVGRHMRYVVDLIYEGNLMTVSSLIADSSRERKKDDGTASSSSTTGESAKKLLRADPARLERAREIVRSIEREKGSTENDVALRNSLIVYGIAVIFMRKSALAGFQESSTIGDMNLLDVLNTSVLPELAQCAVYGR